MKLKGRSYGRYPVLEEVYDYYLREDISKVLFDLTRTRRTFFKWRLREKGKTHSEEVIAGTTDQFRTFIEGSLNRLPPETRFNRYPHFEARAARYQERQIGKDPFGYDFLFESDGLSLRDNFGKFDLVLGILEGYGVPYLAKFSGNTSLHVIIPAEAFPEIIKGESVVANWPLVDSAIASYLRVFGKTEIDHEPTGSLPYSLSRKTGLVSLPLLREGLEGFEPWMANLHLIEKAKMPTAMRLDAVGNAMKSTGEFLEDVLTWHEPRMSLRKRGKRKAQASSRLLRQMRASVNSKPLEFWIGLLSSQRGQERVRGAWGLLWHKDREKAAGEIVKHLKDPCPDVRYYLIALMAKIGPERFPRRIKEALASSVRDRHEIMAIEDLLVIDRKDGLSIVLSSLSKRLNRWGVQMEVSALRRMKLSRNIFKKLISSDDAGIRIATAVAVGKLRDASSINFLENMLDDPSREVRLAVISSLGLIGEASSIKALSSMFERQPIIVRRKAIQALSRINDPKALRIICDKALKGDLGTRIEAIRVLDGRSGEWVQNTLLATFLKDKHPRVRLTAQRLLLHRERKTAIKAIEQALQIEDKIIKREAESLRKKYRVEHFPLAWSLDNI